MKNNSNNFRQCPGCKAVFPRNDDLPTHSYGVISPECWAAFNAILAYDMEYLGYTRIRSLIVNACGVQHPQNFELQKQLGIEERFVRASVQSVGRHLIGLYCVIEAHMEPTKVAEIMADIINHGEKLDLLNPPENLGTTTTADFSPNFTPEQFKEFAEKWAHLVWDAWAQYHDTVRGWIKKYAHHDLVN